MTAGYRTAEQPDIWLAPSIGRTSLVRPVLRCLYPAFALAPVGFFFSIYWPLWVVASIGGLGVVATLALLIDRLVFRREVVRDDDGLFRLRHGFVTRDEVAPSEVEAVVFRDGLRPELHLSGGRRYPLVWSPALDELIHVSPRTREEPPARVERRDYYAAARLACRVTGAQALFAYGYAQFLIAFGCHVSHTSCDLQLIWFLNILAFGFVVSRLAVAYGCAVDVRYLDGRRARRWLGFVR